MKNRVVTAAFMAMLTLQSPAEPSRLPLKFVHLTDLHVVPGNANEASLHRIVDEINRDEYPFVVVSGDISNDGSDVELKTVHDALARLKIPYYIISGNHETNWSESAGQTFTKLWGEDRFSFLLDSTLLVGFPCGPYMKMGDGFVKYEDLQWLDQTIKSELKEGMTLLSFAHYPLSDGLSNWEAVTTILKQAPKRAAFCGHGHNIGLMNFDGVAGIMGRATVLRGDTVPGYNIVELQGDSLFLHEKILGGSLERKIAITLADASSIAAIRSSTSSAVVAAKGTMRQLFQDDASIYNGVAATGNLLIWGNSLGQLKAFDMVSNQLLWSVDTGASIYAKPLCHEEIVVVGSVTGEVIAYNMKSGAKLWSVAAPHIVVGEGVIDDGSLYIAASKEFLKIDLERGEVLWRNTLPESYAQGRPVIAGNRILFGTWDTHLYALCCTTGELRWKWNNGKRANLLSPGNVAPVVSNQKLFLVAPDRYMTALDLESGKELWRSNRYKVRESMGLSADGSMVYAKLMDGELLAVSTTSEAFDPLWVVDLEVGYEHNPAPIVEHNGEIYIGTRQGVVVTVDAAMQQVVRRQKLGNSSINAFTVDKEGVIYCSLIEGSIFQVSQWR